MTETIRLRDDQGEVTADVTGNDVTLPDGQRFEIAPGEHDLVGVRSGDEMMTGAAATGGDTIWVSVESYLFAFHVAREDDTPHATRRGAESLNAPMPATVVRIPVNAGDRVERGDALIVLEAMKMELAIRAPHDAVVRAIHCREGELVQPDQLLVEIE